MLGRWLGLGKQNSQQNSQLPAAQLVNHHTIGLARMQLHNLGFCVAVDAI